MSGRLDRRPVWPAKDQRETFAGARLPPATGQSSTTPQSVATSYSLLLPLLPRFDRLHTSKAHRFVGKRRGEPLGMIGLEHVDRVLPGAADHDPAGRVRTRIAQPFPHVSGHVQATEWADPERIGADRPCTGKLEVRPYLGGLGVPSPGKGSARIAERSAPPLARARQLLAGPARVGGSLIPGDAHHRIVLLARGVRTARPEARSGDTGSVDEGVQD